MKTKHIVIGLLVLGGAYLVWKKFIAPKNGLPAYVNDTSAPIKGVKQ